MALFENKIQLKIKKFYAFKQISEKVHGILKEICEPQHKFHKGQNYKNFRKDAACPKT